MATGKQRQPNFTAQECLYLAELMGEEYAKFRMSRHKVDKHRFNSMITSASKREMWLLIEEQFNANSLTCRRSANELQKKWENLIAKHRAIYADHKRHLNMTGSAPIDTKYSLLTEAVLEVIGKDSATVSGLGSEFLDTTFRQISK